jgi:hypothetical protein
MIEPDHRLFKSRTDFGSLAIERDVMAASSDIMRGYLLGLETAAAVCRSHIVSATEKFGPASSGVKIGRADLCCIQREIRRTKIKIASRS